MRSFLVRLAFVVAVLGIPILGTSYFFVSQISDDIRIATLEHESLVAFSTVAALFPLLETVHRDLAAAASNRTKARAAVDRASILVGKTYADRALPGEARARLRAWRATWARVRERPDAAQLDRLVDRLRDLGSELEADSPLDYDPSYTIQNLAALILRQEPRSIAALRQALDAVADAAGPQLTTRDVVAIATGRALQVQPLELAADDLATAISLEPSLAAQLAPPARSAGIATARLHRLVDSILTTGSRTRAEASAVEMLGRTAIDAHERIWLQSRRKTDRLVLGRLNAQLVRRRFMVALSFVAVLLGTIGIVLIGRDMARRDRIEVASARLEGDTLRAELARFTLERALRVQEAQFKTVFENAHFGIAILDAGGSLSQCNAAVANILGASTEAVLREYEPAIANFRNAERPPLTVQTHRAVDAGSLKWLELTFSGAYVDGACQMIIVLVRDTTEEQTLQQQLQYEVNHDALTRIATRAAFERALREQLERGRLGEPYALLYIDLDSFKPVNDTYGHAAGDHVLVTVAERLLAAVSSEDVCARLGGDEFAVLLRGTSEREAVETIADRLRGSIAKPIAFGNVRLEVTASIGIALGTVEYETSDAIKHHADLALYAVKKCGRGAQRIYERPTPSATLS